MQLQIDEIVTKSNWTPITRKAVAFLNTFLKEGSLSTDAHEIWSYLGEAVSRQFDKNDPRCSSWSECLSGYAAKFGEHNLWINLERVFPASLLAFDFRLSGSSMERYERVIKDLTEDEITSLFEHDPWLHNLALNIWEYAHGKSHLKSFPWNLSIPIADVCNARCTFCTSWLEGRELVKLSQIDALAEPIKRASLLGLVGHGEPMSHPKFRELAQKLGALLDPRASLYTITNGYFLSDYLEEIKGLHIKSFSISLNASSAETHETVMGLGTDGFDRVISGIKKLVHLRETFDSELQIFITMVVTAQNVHEAASFVRLGNQLGVSGIWFRSLLPQSTLIEGLNYHTLSPSQAPGFENHWAAAVQAIENSQVPVQAEPAAWRLDVLAPNLRAQVNKSPPDFVDRAVALKDRDLRRKSQHLYKQASSSFRGQRRNDPGAMLTIANGGMEIETSAIPWSLAVEIKVSNQIGQQPEGATVRLRANVHASRGVIGVGILDVLKNAYISRDFYTMRQGAGLELALPSSGDYSLVIENGLTDGGVSAGRISDAYFEIQSNDKTTHTQLVDLLSNTVLHNAADPLEDGLNPLNRMPRFACRAVYYNLYINEMFFRMNPCCYMQNVPGFDELRFDGSRPFPEAWNSAAMVDLREKLRDGPLYAACRRCPEKW